MIAVLDSLALDSFWLLPQQCESSKGTRHDQSLLWFLRSARTLWALYVPFINVPTDAAVALPKYTLYDFVCYGIFDVCCCKMSWLHFVYWMATSVIEHMRICFVAFGPLFGYWICEATLSLVEIPLVLAQLAFQLNKQSSKRASNQPNNPPNHLPANPAIRRPIHHPTYPTTPRSTARPTHTPIYPPKPPTSSPTNRLTSQQDCKL